MEVYVFTSRNLTNIWAGIGARRWAVSRAQAEMPATPTKASRMRIGAAGLLYCSDTQTLTTPFLVYSRPELEIIVANIWPEEWMLPFHIHPLGTPERQLHKDQLQHLLPSVRDGERAWHHVFHIQPTTVFAPSQITNEDWEILLQHLV